MYEFEKHHDPIRPPEQTIRRGYETSEPSVRGMVIFLISFVVVAGGCLVALVWLYLLLWTTMPDTPRSVLLGDQRPVPGEPLRQPQVLMPPQPRLQPSGSMGEWSIAHTPPMDFKDYHQIQSALLNGWSVDLWSGSICMPIDQAMALAISRLPVKPMPPKHLPRPNYSGGI